MECINHNDKKAQNICKICEQWYCEDCIIEIDGNIYCKSCIKNNIMKNNNTNSDNFKNHSDSKMKNILIFILSLIPGFGQMYFGYIKRGTLIFTIFLALFVSHYLVILNFVLVFFSVFDTFRIKENKANSIYMEDGIKDIKNFIKKNKFIFIICLVLIILPQAVIHIKSITNNFYIYFDYIFDDFFEDFFEDFFIPIIILMFFLILIIKFVLLKNKNKNDNEIIEPKNKIEKKDED